MEPPALQVVMALRSASRSLNHICAKVRRFRCGNYRIAALRHFCSNICVF
jgi:hypothetical protein